MRKRQALKKYRNKTVQLHFSYALLLPKTSFGVLLQHVVQQKSGFVQKFRLHYSNITTTNESDFISAIDTAAAVHIVHYVTFFC